MRVLALLGVVCLLVSPLTHTSGLGLFGVGSIGTARAQALPKSLEEGGTDAAMKVRKNNWTVGVAGGQLSGTYMTFANELAEVPRRRRQSAGHSDRPQILTICYTSAMSTSR
jgi:hypothetical protein